MEILVTSCDDCPMENGVGCYAIEGLQTWGDDGDNRPIECPLRTGTIVIKDKGQDNE